MTTNSASYLTELHQLLSKHFNLADIQDLCFRLNVDYESVSGEEKPSRIRALLLGLGRNGRLADLVTLAREQRPHITWPDPPPPDQQVTAAESDLKQAKSKYNIDARDAEIGVIGDQTKVDGGIHFGGKSDSK